MLPPRSQSLALRALGRLQPRTGKRGQANGDRRDVFQFSFGLGIAIRSGGRFKSQHLLSCILCDTENVPSVPNFPNFCPIRRRLVLHPKDWPWSSWAFYATG